MKKMNNKGFSLVELIIVIAIMAILIVVLAPQYLKYVEKSRNSTDLQSITELKDACEVWAADPDAGTGGTTAFTTGNFSITIGPTGPGTIPAAVQSALDNSGVSASKLKCMSKNNWTSITVYGEVTTSGTIEWSYENAGTDKTAFSTAIGGKQHTGGGA